MSGKVPIALFCAALLASCAGPGNLHRVDAKVWRSSQPTRHDFRKLKNEQGIGEVLCLRRWHSDVEEARGLKLHHIRMNAGEIHDEDIVAALRVMVSAEKPLLVHCFHGSDRTGVVVAMYRMVVQDWPREKAIAELTDPRHGHHADVFPNIRDYLETVDVESIRRRVYREKDIFAYSPSPISSSRKLLTRSFVSRVRVPSWTSGHLLPPRASASALKSASASR